MAKPLLVIGRSDCVPIGLPSDRIRFLRTPEEICAVLKRPSSGPFLLERGGKEQLYACLSKIQDVSNSILVSSELQADELLMLRALFRHVVAPEPPIKLLPLPEIIEIMAHPNAEELLIGGMFEPHARVLVLFRGDLNTLVVPVSHVVDRAKERPDLPQPDPDDFEVIDYGHGVRLGAYEIATTGILYEFDPVYRRKEKKRRIEQERTFGASLRRLRLQKGLKRHEFAPLDEKTIARIERNEIGKPHGKTLSVLADMLGVRPEDIETY